MGLTHNFNENGWYALSKYKAPWGGGVNNIQNRGQGYFMQWDNINLNGTRTNVNDTKVRYIVISAAKTVDKNYFRTTNTRPPARIYLGGIKINGEILDTRANGVVYLPGDENKNTEVIIGPLLNGKYIDYEYLVKFLNNC